MNDINPEDTAKAARSNDAITPGNPPWQAPLRSGSPLTEKLSVPQLPVHQFPASAALPRGNSISAWPKVDTTVLMTQASLARGPRAEVACAPDSPLDRNPNLRAYRRPTGSMLRRYLCYSLESRRVPSAPGSED